MNEYPLFDMLLERHREAAVRAARAEIADDIAKAQASGDPSHLLACWLLLHAKGMEHLHRLAHADEMQWYRAEQPQHPH